MFLLIPTKCKNLELGKKFEVMVRLNAYLLAWTQLNIFVYETFISRAFCC